MTPGRYLRRQEGGASSQRVRRLHPRRLFLCHPGEKDLRLRAVLLELALAPQQLGSIKEQASQQDFFLQQLPPCSAPRSHHLPQHVHHFRFAYHAQALWEDCAQPIPYVSCTTHSSLVKSLQADTLL